MRYLYSLRLRVYVQLFAAAGKPTAARSGIEVLANNRAGRTNAAAKGNLAAGLLPGSVLNIKFVDTQRGRNIIY